MGGLTSAKRTMHLGVAVAITMCYLFSQRASAWLVPASPARVNEVLYLQQSGPSSRRAKSFTNPKFNTFLHGRAFVAAAAAAASVAAFQARGASRRSSTAAAAAAKTAAPVQSEAAKVDAAKDKTSEFVMKVFNICDGNKNNFINYQEFQFAMTILEQCKIKLTQKESDALFYRMCSSSMETWKRASLEWMNESLEQDVDDCWAENRWDVNHEFTLDEFTDLVRRINDKHILLLAEEDVDAGWKDLHANFFQTRSKAEFVHAIKTACVDSFDSILTRTEKEIGKELGGAQIHTAKVLMNKQHDFDVAHDDILLYFRTHGRIKRPKWFQGMFKLIEKDRLKNPKQNLVSEVALGDPELFRKTLDNGIPRQMAYDFSQWSRAQSSDRYWKSLRILLTQKQVLQRLAWPMTICTSAALLVQLSAKLLAWTGRPPITMPPEVFTLSSAPLGLLLVFRTNMSYARFDEARKIWGDNFNRCRDLMRQCIWIKDPKASARFLGLIPVFAASLMCLLRKPGRHDLALEVGTHLSQREIRQMETSDLPAPIWTLRQMSIIADSVHDESPMKHQLISRNISELIANVGKCQRIFSTPMPATYTALTTRFLIVWLVLLPFMLYPKLKDGCFLAEMLMAFFLLGIEDLGVQIEEPFSVLALKRIVSSIRSESTAAALDLKKPAQEGAKEGVVQAVNGRVAVPA